jgi:hypothetical protein
MMSPQFASLLASGRSEFNRRVAETRRRYPAFDTAAFGTFVQGPADQIFRAAAAAGVADSLPAVAMAAFDVALELVAHGQGGGIAEQVWCELAPRYAALLCAQPASVLGMLTNAALHLEKSGHARPPQWLALMAELAPQVAHVRQLGAVGQICAWRAGMAHFRQGAIAAADSLPDTLALAAFGVSAHADGVPAGAWPGLRETVQRNPWWTPVHAARGRAMDGMDVGSFTGFGGAFPEPPEVRPAADGFWVRSGERYALLVADACGAVLHAATQDEYEYPQPPAVRAKVSQSGQRLAINGREFTVDLPADALRVVCNAHTVAITSPYSHAIRVLPLP